MTLGKGGKRDAGSTFPLIPSPCRLWSPGSPRHGDRLQQHRRPGRATRTVARAHTHTHTPRRELHTADFCLTSRPQAPSGRDRRLLWPRAETPFHTHPLKHTHSGPALDPKGAGNHLREARTAPDSKRLPSQLPDPANLQTRLKQAAR